MSSKHGIVVTMVAKEGKVEELIKFCQEHLVRQHDGREELANCASIFLPNPSEPNTVRLFEQWDSLAGIQHHRSAGNANTQLFMETVPPLLACDMAVIEASTLHYRK
eukprot:jgi/Psemu1/312306/fgenesh1_kg.917_\